MDGRKSHLMRICPICGKVFTPHPHGNAVRRQTFCGPKCKRRHFDLKKRKSWKPKPLPTTKIEKKRRQYVRSIPKFREVSGIKDRGSFQFHEISLRKEVGRACDQALQRNYASG